MNSTYEPSIASSVRSSVATTDTVLAALSAELEQLTPEVRKAASFMLDNPAEISICSMREMAVLAKVKPNTLVRLARSIGFDGFDEFRAPFREEVRRGVNFPDRVRWLQALGKSGQMGGLYSELIGAAIGNIEQTFGNIDERQLTMAANAIWSSRQTFTLGVGVNSSNAHNFTYLARTGMVQFHAIPRAASTAVDDLAWADSRDVLIAITCKPYRSEVVNAVNLARKRGVQIIGISDSAASPVVVGSEHGFVISVDTPNLFPSSVATIALLETLLSFVFASASNKIASRVKAFHENRYEQGIYTEELE